MLTSLKMKIASLVWGRFSELTSGIQTRRLFKTSDNSQVWIGNPVPKHCITFWYRFSWFQLLSFNQGKHYCSRRHAVFTVRQKLEFVCFQFQHDDTPLMHTATKQAGKMFFFPHVWCRCTLQSCIQHLPEPHPAPFGWTVTPLWARLYHPPSLSDLADTLEFEWEWIPARLKNLVEGYSGGFEVMAMFVCPHTFIHFTWSARSDLYHSDVVTPSNHQEAVLI